MKAGTVVKRKDGILMTVRRDMGDAVVVNWFYGDHLNQDIFQKDDLEILGADVELT